MSPSRPSSISPSSPASSSSRLPAPSDLRDRRVFLLGEVHDNADGHARRLQLLRGLLATGARPAIVLEQIDRERQPALDRALASTPPPSAPALVDAIGGLPGWERRFYEPVIALALEQRLPIVAGNVSRADARKVMSGGLAATGFEAAVPADVQAAHVGDIVASHCGQVDRPTAARMAAAQVARDQEMARLAVRHAERGVVVLAGNGHVRKDVGVFRWLPTALQRQTLAVGFIEEAAGAAEAAAFDRTVVVAPRADRADPCAGLSSR